MTDKNLNRTMLFDSPNEKKKDIREIVNEVVKALEEKGYNPNNQIVGYILSGDPTYITSHLQARKIIRQIDRDELLEELLEFYLKNE